MFIYVCLSALFIWLLAVEVHATSFGYRGEANVIAVNNKPAICIPPEATKKISVGWVSLSESYVRYAGGWGITLKPDSAPLVLKAGECFVFGDVPEGYETDEHEIKTAKLKLEINRTYVFRLNDADYPRDSYSAVFCISKVASGTMEYLQYTRLADGTEVIPSCDARRNGKVPE